MSVDILLTIITLVVAVIGTLLKDPTRGVKIFLIGLAVLASIGSIVKALDDEADKRFMENALISTLSPPNPAYKALQADIEKAIQPDFDQDYCFHNTDGMTCFLSKSDNTKNATVVFNRSEVAALYANDLRRASNKTLINKGLSDQFEPAKMDEDFEDKVGILGCAICFQATNFWGEYTYDDKAVRVTCKDKSNNESQMMLTSSELATVSPQKSGELFYDLEQRFRKQLDGSQPK